MKILMVSPVPTHPTSEGNRVRVVRLAESLGQFGHVVEYAYVPDIMEPLDLDAMGRFWGDRLHVLPRVAVERSVRTLAQSLLHRVAPVHPRWTASGNLFCDQWYSRSVHRSLVELARRGNYHAVCVEYAFFSKAFAAFPASTLKVVDTHDIFAGRHEKMQRAGLRSKWTTTTEEEAHLLRRADALIAITEHDRQYFAALVDRPVATVGHLLPNVGQPRRAVRATDLLFVGSDNQVNLQAARILIDEVLPLVRARVPAAKLYIAGRVGARLTPCDGCELLGEVPDLGAVYAREVVVVNAVQVGTGLAIKTIEALAHGCPTVATTAGARGLQMGSGHAFLVADTTPELAAAVVRVMQSPRLASELSVAAHEFVRHWNEAGLEELRRCFAQTSRRLPPRP